MSVIEAEIIDPERQAVGDGGEIVPDVLKRREMVLLRSAIKRGFPIPDEVKADVIARMHMIVQSSPSERDAASAARVIVAAEGVNVKRDNGPSQHQHVHIHGDAPGMPQKPKSLAELKGMLGGQPSTVES